MKERQNIYPLNPGQAKVLKATIYDLSELAAKQVLYGVIQVLSLKTSISIAHFEECVDDARKLTEVRKADATYVNKKEKTGEGSG